MHKKQGKKKVIIDIIDFIGIKSHYKAREKGEKPTKCRRENKL